MTSPSRTREQLTLSNQRLAYENMHLRMALRMVTICKTTCAGCQSVAKKALQATRPPRLDEDALATLHKGKARE